MRFDYITELSRVSGKHVTIFDLETTTFRGRPNFGIMEVAALTVTPGGAVAYGHLINPEKAISREAEELTGITQSMVRQAPTWAKYATLMQTIAREHIVSGFNISTFDCPAVLELNQRYGQPIEGGFANVLDARTLYMKATGQKKGKLPEAAAQFGQQPDGELHRAAADVALTVNLLDALLEDQGLERALELCGLRQAPSERSKARRTPRVQPAAVPSTEALLAALRQAREYSFENMAKALGRSARDVEFDLCKAYDRGDISVDDAAHGETREWLKAGLFEVMSDPATPWDGRLKPLLERLKALDKPDSVQLDYLQLRVGLDDAGLRPRPH